MASLCAFFVCLSLREAGSRCRSWDLGGLGFRLSWVYGFRVSVFRIAGLLIYWSEIRYAPTGLRKTCPEKTTSRHTADDEP